MPPAPDYQAILDAVSKRYARAARCVDHLFRYPTGREGALQLGYPSAWIESAPAEMVAGFCGVGNPFAPGPVSPGDSVLDVGCGAGFDLFCASLLTGPEGWAEGIDPTPEMIVQAEKNLKAAGAVNASVQPAAAERLPFPEASFEVVVSNGALHLTIDKKRAFSEIHRVLKESGRLQFADVVLSRELPPEDMTVVAWSN